MNELSRRALNLARPPTEQQAASNALLVRIGQERYAVALGELLLIQPAQITPLPLTAPFVAGLLNVRGVLTTVLHADLLLGITRERPADGMVLISRHEGQQVGLLVDEVLGLQASDPAELQPPLRGGKVVRGINGDGIGWIDLASLYAALPPAWSHDRSKG